MNEVSGDINVTDWPESFFLTHKLYIKNSYVFAFYCKRDIWYDLSSNKYYKNLIFFKFSNIFYKDLILNLYW